ncbi:MAG: hypothetical protein JO070_03525 [Verrucomicrobia bacterium]|nr:hypothetical protein [Verrucomicrobiota bacterium]
MSSSILPARDFCGLARGQWIILLILSLPSIYILLTLPPLWRDSDGFNEVASTFAPKAIIHWLPGYCLFGRLILIGAGTVGSLLGGHGIPYLSISITPLNDVGIYTLLVVQHLFLVFSLFFTVRTLSDSFVLRCVFAACFALTPWLYIYANCVGSEAFSNPLVYLIVAQGWNCLRSNELSRRSVLIYFALLVAAALTRQINAIFASLLPLVLLPLTISELIQRGTSSALSNLQTRLSNSRRFLIFIVVGLFAIGISVLVQQTMCWLFRVPFRSTFGETFEWRLSYLDGLSERDRADIVNRISRKLGDPVITESLEALDQSLSLGNKWADMFLFYKIDEILVRSGFHEMQKRTWQIDLKLNRIATCVLLQAEPHFWKAVWSDFLRSPLFTQTDLAYPPFVLTDWLQTQLPEPRYGRLRGLASFQYEAGHYNAIWQRVPYFHMFEGIPMLVMVGLTVVFGSYALRSASRVPLAKLGICYAIGLIALGFLVALGNCLTTFFGARFYLPVYSLYQTGMMLAISLAITVHIEKLESFRNPR